MFLTVLLKAEAGLNRFVQAPNENPTVSNFAMVLFTINKQKLFVKFSNEFMRFII